MTCVNCKGKPVCKNSLLRGATIPEAKLLETRQASEKREANMAKCGAILQPRETKRGGIFQLRKTKCETISKPRVNQLDCRIRTDPRVSRPELDSRDPKKLQWAPKPSQKLDGPHSSMTKVTDLREYLSKKRGI